jgi:hypothetical protein
MIFVLGSNEGGLHGTGAATFAVKKHGAKAGQAFGLQGTAFGIPTQEVKMRNGRRVVGDSLLLQQIRTYVNQCIDFAKERPEMEFEVTQIGGGLAGFRPKQVAPWFENAADNCLFDEAWRAHRGDTKRYWRTK